MAFHPAATGRAGTSFRGRRFRLAMLAGSLIMIIELESGNAVETSWTNLSCEWPIRITSSRCSR